MAGHKKRREARGAEGRGAERAKVGKGAEGKAAPVLTAEQLEKRKVSNVSTYIKKVLKEGGKYDPTLTYQVEQTATTMTISRKIADEILKQTSAVETETSREGHGRVKINPLFELYLKFDSANRHNLRALAMNRENMKTADDQLDDGEDAVVALLKQMTQEEGEE